MKRRILITSVAIVLALILSSCRALWNLYYNPGFTKDVKNLLEKRAGVKVNPRCSLITRTPSGTCIFKGSPKLVNRLVESFNLTQTIHFSAAIEIETTEIPSMLKQRCDYLPEFDGQKPTQAYENKRGEVISADDSSTVAFTEFSLYHRTDTNRICLQLLYDFNLMLF